MSIFNYTLHVKRFIGFRRFENVAFHEYNTDTRTLKVRFKNNRTMIIHTPGGVEFHISEDYLRQLAQYKEMVQKQLAQRLAKDVDTDRVLPPEYGKVVSEEQTRPIKYPEPAPAPQPLPLAADPRLSHEAKMAALPEWAKPAQVSAEDIMAKFDEEYRNQWPSQAKNSLDSGFPEEAH